MENWNKNWVISGYQNLLEEAKNHDIKSGTEIYSMPVKFSNKFAGIFFRTCDVIETAHEIVAEEYLKRVNKSYGGKIYDQDLSVEKLMFMSLRNFSNVSLSDIYIHGIERYIKLQLRTLKKYHPLQNQDGNLNIRYNRICTEMPEFMKHMIPLTRSRVKFIADKKHTYVRIQKLPILEACGNYLFPRTDNISNLKLLVRYSESGVMEPRLECTGILSLEYITKFGFPF